MRNVLIFDADAEACHADAYEIVKFNDLPAFTREPYPDEFPIIRELHRFTYANSHPRDGIQLAIVYDDTLSLHNSTLMNPYAIEHNHQLNPFALSDVPLVSLTKLDHSRPIIVLNHEGVHTILWVRDPFLTTSEIVVFCKWEHVPARYQDTGYDRDGKCYPFNLDYLRMIRKQTRVVGRKLICAKFNREYDDGITFIDDR
ncbi:hypothetical protein BDZ89DRAFT_1148460 [Hymenopellis radicata]|nr:hypothetical protein BDZ89DRAFT_1148460 [Hymenopellis radicata]